MAQDVAEPAELNYATPRLRRAMARLLAHEARGDDADSQVLAAAAGRLLDQLSERLAVVIGRAGIDALVLRALKLRKPDFPFLSEQLFSREKGESTGDVLRARLQGQEPDIVREVWVTVFATTAGLLVTVIGERLAWSLLREVWPDARLSGTQLQETEE